MSKSTCKHPLHTRHYWRVTTGFNYIDCSKKAFLRATVPSTSKVSLHGFSVRLLNSIVKKVKLQQSFLCVPLMVSSLGNSDFLSVLSPRSGEGEGLGSAPGQLFIVRQQPVHQPQRQRCVGVRRRLRLQLRVGAGRAPQQEEGAHGGQLERRAP